MTAPTKHRVVVGLSGSGDGNSGLTLQSLQSLISRLGLVVDAQDLNAKNAAAVMVTGSHIPADRNGLKFYLPGGEIAKTADVRGGGVHLMLRSR